MKHYPLPMAAWTAALASVLSLLASPSSAKLSSAYYHKSCPTVEQIVSDVVTTKQINSPTTAAATLRLFFHDCFVGGCDASMLVSTNAFNIAERDADDNASLPGDAFDVIIRAKIALELQCPGVVSCADILAIATRDLLVMLGGPFFHVRLGRKDAIESNVAAVDGNLPRTNMTMDQVIALFAKNKFNVQEMVALIGAHTVGFSHCSEFAWRIYGYNGGEEGAHDPGLSPPYARELQKACANYRKDPTLTAFNDVMTPGKFDNMYYRNLLGGMGLLATDTAMAADPRTRPIVELYAANQTAFFKDFGRVMEKLSVLGVKAGSDGEIHRRCDAFNSLSI